VCARNEDTGLGARYEVKKLSSNHVEGESYNNVLFFLIHKEGNFKWDHLLQKHQKTPGSWLFSTHWGSQADRNGAGGKVVLPKHKV